MKHSRSLFAKLAWVLLAVVAASGVLYVLVTAVVSRGYQRELHQNLYRTLAANLVQEGHLMAAGEVQQDVLYDVFHMMMVINPAIEVYLIDPEGRLLAFSAPEEVVVRKEVDLEPITRFLELDSRLPILGDDPRHRDGRKVFSAAPIGPAESPEGYLYVVLGGTEYDSVAALLAGSYFVRLGVAGLFGALLVSLAAGLWLFYYLTRRLRGLSRRVVAFETKAGLEPAAASDAVANEGDEIEQLGGSFDRMAERLLRQVVELRQLDSLRRELIANVSHDLRTPLTSLQGYLETLRLKDDTMSAADRLRYLDIAERQAARLSRLVAELFELAKLDAGGVELHREPLALGELVQDIVGEYRLAAERRGVKLEAALPAGLAWVSADIGLIARVLGNLVDNALRHTPEGGRVRVGVDVQPQAVAIEISDTGQGIDAEDLPRLFDRFFYRRSGRRAQAGTGLGLAIAQRSLELHGASIKVESALGHGSTFSFALPRVA